MEDSSEVLSSFSPRQRRMLRVLTEGSESILNELLQDFKGNTEQQKHQKSPKQCVTKSAEKLSVIESELVESSGLSPQLVIEILEEN
jgi:hypothetical protein